MGSPAAKQGDHIFAVDNHDILPPSSTSSVMTPLPFFGIIDGGLSQNVNIMGLPAATVDSTASNTPPHISAPGTFVTPPQDKATVAQGSSSVNIGGKPAARAGDPADTCNDDGTSQGGTIIASGSVMIG